LFRWQEGEGNAVLDPDRLSCLEGTLVLRWRQGGESFKPAGRPTRPLRKWWQDAGLPPWWRERTPLLYAGDRLIAVPGLGVTEGCQAADGVRGWRPAWSPGGVLSDGTTSLPLR
jgi:tRNA(Ile)-lysidine synthase